MTGGGGDKQEQNAKRVVGQGADFCPLPNIVADIDLTSC